MPDPTQPLGPTPLTVHRSDTAKRVVGALRDTAPAGGAYQLPLARLYERFDAVATGRAPADGDDPHRRILDRLAANLAFAQAAGWTACALERDGGMGRLRLVGVASAGEGRTVVPDWTAGVAAAARRRAGSAPPASAPRVTPPPPRLVRG